MIEYTAKDIKILEGIEAVRKRPAMYIGDTGEKGLHHLLEEIIDNSIDEYLAGHATQIKVAIHKDGSVSVEDNGRGIPVDIHPKIGKSALEVIATTLHAGGKFDKKVYKVSGGLHGVGVTVVNALSEWMEITVFRNGKIYRQKYIRGKPITPVEVLGKTEKRGTIVKFKPDPLIFGDQEFKPERIKTRLKELAFLCPKLKIIFINEKTGEKEEYLSKEGLKDFIRYIWEGQSFMFEPVVIKGKREEVFAEIAFSYADTFLSKIFAFTNNIENEGGTHVTGFKSALTRALNEYIRQEKLLKQGKILGEDAETGLIAIISVKHPNPQFEGQTKTKLANPEVKSIIEKIFYSQFFEWLEKHPTEAKIIANKAITAMKAREAAKKAKELILAKATLKRTILPGKLADCLTNDPNKAELFIVEGESAGGSAKQGRDRNFQAILALKGKIINIEKASVLKILKNNEIKNIIQAIGAGFGKDFDIDRVRYKKIIIMTDADVDGSHIRTLLLAFFYRFMRPLIEEGCLYIAQPPLYKIWKGKNIKYAYTEEEKNQILKEMPEANVQRYKGLGEMNPEQLWETTMNPKTRRLKLVTIEQAEEAERLLSVLLGKDVKPRKKFIIKHALEVKELDV